MIRTNLKEDHCVLKSCQKFEADNVFIEFLHGIQISYSEDNFAKSLNGSGGFTQFQPSSLPGSIDLGWLARKVDPPTDQPDRYEQE
jgi:hypothetical protein